MSDRAGANILFGCVVVLAVLVVWVNHRYNEAAGRADLMRQQRDIYGAQVQRVHDECAVNRVDGSAKCPPGVFSTLVAAP